MHRESEGLAETAQILVARDRNRTESSEERRLDLGIDKGEAPRPENLG